jgi:hypothetical protein
MGKKKCCCQPPSKLLRYVNLTVDGGFNLTGGNEVTLFNEVQANQAYCVFGNLKDWFDLSTGAFTVQENGLYLITVLPTFQAETNTNGSRLVRVRRTYGKPRCNGTSLQEISLFAQTEVLDTATEFQSLTFSGVQPLQAGDKLDFLAESSVDTTLLFEFNIVKLSYANASLFDPAQTLPPN